ncbi:MAG: Nif3-like dinuclear metal center hexameric protein [Clostridia bacterium]|nr:Nif3-like dinuclear metal center hexameric protein [Clostridia bacterium]
MKLIDFYKILDGVAPKSISDEYCASYGAYDNSGILVDSGEEVKKAVFALDLSKAAIARAKSFGANLIVTHHPAIYGKISDVKADTDLGGKLVECIKNGISVISMHLNLDCANGGVDESLADAVAKASSTPFGERKINHVLSLGGYGRVYDVQPCLASELAKGLGKELSSQKVLVYNENKKISRVASFCGAGGDDEGLRFARKMGADVMISSDFKHHVIAAAVEAGLAVIAITHYSSENYGFKKYYEKIIGQTDVACEFFTDESLL